MTTPAAGVLRGTLLRLGDDVRADHILPPAYAFLSDPAEMGKYALSAAVVVAALKYRIADPIALLVGASVLLPALVRESVACAEPTRKEA